MTDSSTLTLTEYERKTVPDLADEDAAYMKNDGGIGRRLTVSRDFEGNYEIDPGQHVGVAVLPSGRKLVSQPKVSVSNVLYMFGRAAGMKDAFFEAIARFNSMEEILEAVVLYFAELVEMQIDRGLYRAYIEQENNLTAVRGRIVLAQDLRENFVLKHRKFCRYSELTWDVSENQIVRQVAHLLGSWPFSRSTRLRLRRIDAQLAEIGRTRFTAAAIDRFRYHRANDEYRPMHHLCRLFLEGASLHEAEGVVEFRTFLIDMNKLFETYVTEELGRCLRGRFAVRDQFKVDIGEGGRLWGQPDIGLFRAGQPVLVADCKYKKVESEIFKNADYYQVITYCTAMGITRGVLIYPKHTGGVNQEVPIQNSDIVIKQLTIDLDKPRAELDLECERVARLLSDWLTLDAASLAA